ncbi:MAG: pseudopilin, cryptic, ral secretion pathway [Deltaproteobacteria bacterium]|nr:pseudopilin, cryptic, ral secretion pathway [Deltaproteobacteria bacterium]
MSIRSSLLAAHRRSLAPRRQSLALRTAHRGMTLLEIMIVIAILGLLIAVVVPRVMSALGSSKVSLTKVAVNKLADQAYPQWAIKNTDKSCPDNLAEVGAVVEMKPEDLVDAWGSPYKFLCAPNLPAGVKNGIAVYSLGEDKAENTADDVRSWEKVKN